MVDLENRNHQMLDTRELQTLKGQVAALEGKVVALGEAGARLGPLEERLQSLDDAARSSAEAVSAGLARIAGAAAVPTALKELAARVDDLERKDPLDPLPHPLTKRLGVLTIARRRLKGKMGTFSGAGGARNLRPFASHDSQGPFWCCGFSVDGHIPCGCRQSRSIESHRIFPPPPTLTNAHIRLPTSMFRPVS